MKIEDYNRSNVYPRIIKDEDSEEEKSNLIDSLFFYLIIDSQPEDVQIIAVGRYYDYIKYIKNPSDAVQLEAVLNNGLAIQYIKNPSEAVQLVAVLSNWESIQYIDEPSEAVKAEAILVFASMVNNK